MGRQRHAAFLNAAGALFANTYLFEFSFRTRSLTFSDNLPQELQPAGRLESSPCAEQLGTLLHKEDIEKLKSLIQTPPPRGQEAVRELRLLHRNGCYVWYECRAVATYDNRGKPTSLLGRFENIDARKRRESNLIACSTRDDLTGLFNRGALILRVEEWLRSPAAGEGGALFMLDLDNFKSINDTRGHASGDRALLLTAKILRETFRGTDILCRAGGDEFLVFMTGVSTPSLAADRAANLCRALACRSGESALGCSFTCSVGVAFCPGDGTDYPSLFEAADAAMYRAKREGKSSYRISGELEEPHGA